VFTLSACMAAVAGALYVPQVGIINPSEFAPANSIEYVIWVAVGGRGTLIGGALGAVLVNYAKTTFTTGFLAPYWLFALGAMFVLVTIFLPKGVLGLLRGRGSSEAAPVIGEGGEQRKPAAPAASPAPGPASQSGGSLPRAAQPAE
jgi:urea transport system permease protein